VNHNDKHNELAPHLEPIVTGRDRRAKMIYLVMRRILRKNRQRIWDETNRVVMDAILYGTGTTSGWSLDGLIQKGTTKA
jgi:hypothetical protein